MSVEEVQSSKPPSKWIMVVLGLAVFCGGPLLLFDYLARGVGHHLERVTGEDKTLEKAITEARKSLVMFDYRLSHPKDDDLFYIRAKFDTPDGPEYLWLRDPTLTTDSKSYKATVDQQPVLAKVEFGSQVVVPQGTVVDWAIKRPGGKIAGGLTELALQGTTR